MRRIRHDDWPRVVSDGVAVDPFIDEGATVLFGETPELTGGEHLIAERCATPTTP